MINNTYSVSTCSGILYKETDIVFNFLYYSIDKSRAGACTTLYILGHGPKSQLPSICIKKSRINKRNRLF